MLGGSRATADVLAAIPVLAGGAFGAGGPIAAVGRGRALSARLAHAPLPVGATAGAQTADVDLLGGPGSLGTPFRGVLLDRSAQAVELAFEDPGARLAADGADDGAHTDGDGHDDERAGEHDRHPEPPERGVPVRLKPHDLAPGALQLPSRRIDLLLQPFACVPCRLVRRPLVLELAL